MFIVGTSSEAGNALCLEDRSKNQAPAVVECVVNCGVGKDQAL